jgi:hypothetical protein
MKGISMRTVQSMPVLFLVCVFFVGDLGSAQDRQRTDPSPDPSKKSHKWLIAVGAAAGFAVGLWLGFQRFDQAINSDQKIWTSAAVGAAAGGIGGWLWARQLDKEPKMQMGWLKHTLRSPDDIAFQSNFFSASTCKRSNNDPLLLQADCICPSILYR